MEVGAGVWVGLDSMVACMPDSIVAPISGVGAEVGSAACTATFTAAATVAAISGVGAGVGVETGACVAQPAPIIVRANKANTKDRWFMTSAYGTVLYSLRA